MHRRSQGCETFGYGFGLVFWAGLIDECGPASGSWFMGSLCGMECMLSVLRGCWGTV